MQVSTTLLQYLATQLEGEFYFDDTIRLLYATDGSHYRELPLAVAMPKTEKDIQTLIHFANEHKTSLIPRTAGTSLAGQVVGNGIVVDVSKYFTKILEINAEEGWVRVQPGVVRDELNMALKEHGLFFGPETSTANRAMIGGMIGNNSCGSNSIIYGSVRDHLVEVKGFLSDGSAVTFNAITKEEFDAKASPQPPKEGQSTPPEGEGQGVRHIYQQINAILNNPENQAEIRAHYPKKSIPRRNTGYALDLLLETEAYIPPPGAGRLFNFCKLIAGSEGTLMFITEAKLHINPMPPSAKALICGHYYSIIESLEANLVALKYNPSACELIDHFILECTKENREQIKNRFFVQGDPQAIMVMEIARDTEAEVDAAVSRLIRELKEKGLGYHLPVLKGAEMVQVWALRKAGLGVLGNMPGSAKPAEVVEDTAVDVADLPAYIAEYHQILEDLKLKSVHYAHAGTGELHLKPILDMKTAQGQRDYRLVAEAVARLVKKYDGSLSGEHGDGRLRGEFIPWMVGDKNYALMVEVKRIFDPNNIFNPGKIVHTPPMDKFLRHEPDQHGHEPKTTFDFSEAGGFLALAEKCTGSADCRKTELTGGTMCPSYMATKNEKDTTRARANILREILNDPSKKNPMASQEIYEVMDLCLSCKGCKGECPSSVDMGKLKAEFLQQYYEVHGIPFRTKLIAHYTYYNRLASIFPPIYNFIFSNPFTSKIAKKITGFAPKRSIPLLYKTTLRKWFKKSSLTPGEGISLAPNRFPKERGVVPPSGGRGLLYLFCDEFTNYNDVEIGIKAVKLLHELGYTVVIPEHLESGRTYLSKGLVKEAQKIAVKNINLLKDKINENAVLVGIEPSAILTFRDEYLSLTDSELQAEAKYIAQYAFTFEEFIAREVDKGNIKPEQFTDTAKLVKVHGHCHQKALSSMTPTKKMLTLPKNYEVHMINSGCCGMAGSFGYEKEHYDISMQVGELVLFPTIRKQPADVIIVAAGTSCRHQIKDGTGRVALHPIEVLWEALRG